MANNIGKFATFQIGRQIAYGTSVAPEVDFQMLNESLSQNVEYKTSEALVGKRGQGDKIIASKKVEGSVSLYPCPHSIGYLLQAFFGKEGDATQVDVSSAYEHIFEFAGVTESLTPLTVHIDRVANDFGYQDVYINKMTFNLSLGDYITADIDLTGKKEINGNSQTITYSVPITKSFRYKGGAIKIDGVTTNGDITSAKVTFENNLKTDRRAFTSSDQEYFLQPTLGEAKVTYDLEFFYNSNTEALRQTNYENDVPVEVELLLTHDEEIENGYPYKLSFHTVSGAMTNFSSNVSGPDELTGSCTVEGQEIDGNPSATVTLTDARDTKYTI